MVQVTLASLLLFNLRLPIWQNQKVFRLASQWQWARTWESRDCQVNLSDVFIRYTFLQPVRTNFIFEASSKINFWKSVTAFFLELVLYMSPPLDCFALPMIILLSQEVDSSGRVEYTWSDLDAFCLHFMSTCQLPSFSQSCCIVTCRGTWGTWEMSCRWPLSIYLSFSSARLVFFSYVWVKRHN